MQIFLLANTQSVRIQRPGANAMAKRPDTQEYLLGANTAELERLRFQHSVWEAVTERFILRLGIKPGWHCLDVGAGPGFVSWDLLDLVGKEGSVTLLDPSAFYLQHARSEAARRKLSNARFLEGRAEDTPLPSSSFDLILARWVISFAPDPDRFIERLIPALKPGGILAIQDYSYEGLSLFPRGGAFDAMADVVRAYYRAGGGDPYVAALVPAAFRRHGLSLIDFSPTCLAGGPDSGVMEWAHRFFTAHIPLMAEQGLMTAADADAAVHDWMAHRTNPDAMFFSPLVVDVAGKKP
jgi:ubiquinone/menaquinone biosynthesis C-methylase UbiE